MTDSQFLNWVADRFLYKYNESPNTDFVTKLRDIAKHVDKLNINHKAVHKSYKPYLHTKLQKTYKYNNVLFEYDRNKPLTPWPLRKDFEPKKKVGRKFYEGIADFLDLSVEEQEYFREHSQ